MKLYQRSFLQLQYYRELGIVTDFFFPFNLFIASTIPAREEYSTSWDMTNFTCFSNTTFLLIVFLVCNNKKAKMLWVMKSLFLGNVWHSGKCLIGEQSLCPSIHFLQPGGDFLKYVIFFFKSIHLYFFFYCFEISDVTYDNDVLYGLLVWSIITSAVMITLKMILESFIKQCTWRLCLSSFFIVVQLLCRLHCCPLSMNWEFFLLGCL